MKFKKYILIFLMFFFALLGLVGSFANVPFLPSRTEIMLRQQILLERWMKSLTHKAKNDHQAVNAPVAVVSPEEAYQRSIELLSDGRQIEAEKIIADAVKNNLDDANLLFAKAVLERSRWSKDASTLWFGIARRKGAHTYIADAVSLKMRLDSRKSTSSDLADLIQLSDAHPDDVYLLWLSAIECREQEKGELGKQQYEKLLAKFRVGPVLLHQTYANILSEILGDHETALKHRYIAISMEAKGWTLQGLANTLTYLKRYEEACAVWARTVQVSPKDSDYWGGWGWTLRMMDRYEEALDKHKEAFRLNHLSGYDAYCAGWCLEQLKRYDEMVGFYRQAAALHYTDGLRAFGWCYAKGNGVPKNIETAVFWYQKAAAQGQTQALCDLAALAERGEGLEQSYSKAKEYYRKAFEADPDGVDTLNYYAWFLATCKDESFRNYPEAVRLAELSVAKEEQNFNLDTLAVAYDRNGQYAKAVDTQKRLIAWRQKKNPDKEIPAGMSKRLADYERKLAEQTSQQKEH